MSTVAAKSKLFLDRDSNGSVMTPREFDEVEDYDSRYRYELIQGVVIVTPIASAGERGPNDELGRLLLNYQESHPKGKSLDNTLPQEHVRIGRSRRLADRVIWSGLGRNPNPLTDMPTIVVEFVSRRKRDRKRDYETKRREYMKLGIREYWIIDRFRRTLTVVSMSHGKECEQNQGEKDIYRTPRLPGFDLPVEKLLVAADRWKR